MISTAGGFAIRVALEIRRGRELLTCEVANHDETAKGLTMRRWNGIYGLCGCLLLSGAYAADCSREDIAYYLREGFTPEQITQLCGTEGAGQGTGNEAGQRPDDYQSLGSEQGDADTPATYLALAIDSNIVFVDDDKISFRRTACAERGRTRVCPDTTLEINFRGLQITGGRESDGQGILEVQGNIQRTINNYDAFSPGQQRVVDRLYTERRAAIPIRESVEFEQAQRALRLLIENANPPQIVSE